jgi:hypothetical protein
VNQSLGKFDNSTILTFAGRSDQLVIVSRFTALKFKLRHADQPITTNLCHVFHLILLYTGDRQSGQRLAAILYACHFHFSY